MTKNQMSVFCYGSFLKARPLPFSNFEVHKKLCHLVFIIWFLVTSWSNEKNKRPWFVSCFITYHFLHKLIFIGMGQYQNDGSNVKHFFFKHSIFIIKLLRANSPPCLHLSLAPPGTFLPVLCKVTPLMHTLTTLSTCMKLQAGYLQSTYH